MDNESTPMDSGMPPESRPMDVRPASSPMMASRSGKKKMASAKVIIPIIIVVVGGLAALAYMYRGMFVAATVNGHMISRLAVVRELEKQSGKKVLDMMITEQLISDEAAKKGITVSGEDVDAEIKKIETQVAGQGGTLDQALAAQSMTRDDLKRQITTQKKVEKLIADKTAVSDAEVDKYITDNKITLPKGQEAETKNQIKDQLKQQKFSQEAQAWVAGLRAQAKIDYTVKYQ